MGFGRNGGVHYTHHGMCTYNVCVVGKAEGALLGSMAPCSHAVRQHKDPDQHAFIHPCNPCNPCNPCINPLVNPFLPRFILSYSCNTPCWLWESLATNVSTYI